MQDCFVYILHGHKKRSRFGDSFCDPCRIQTCNPHIRSVVLYSVELMDPEVSPSSGETGFRRKGHHFPFLKRKPAIKLVFKELTFCGADETRTRDQHDAGIRVFGQSSCGADETRTRDLRRDRPVF